MLTIKKDSLKYRDPNTGQFATVGMLETTVYTDGVLPIDPVEVDKTLTVEGAAADAKATGDALNKKLSEDQVREVIDEVLEQAKESGEFNGEPGQGFVILGVYSTEEELKQKATSPKQGDHYNVGPNAEDEYDLYMYDVNKGWINKGSANGGTGASGTIIDFGDDLPQALGVASAGTSDTATRSDHVHPMPTAKDVGALFVDESGAVDGQPAPVNADTLGGIPASNYVTKEEVPAVSGGLPEGGTAGQVLTKNSETSGDASWQNPPTSIPSGGEKGQVLTKNGSADGDASWQDAASGLPEGGTAGQVLYKKADGAEWKDLPEQQKELPEGGTAGQILTKTSSGGVEWTNKLELDTTLKESNKAADAKVTGDALNQLSEQIENCYTKDNLVFDDAPVEGSTNPITSGAVFDAAGKYSSKAVTPTYGSDVSTYNCKLYRKGNVGFLHAYCRFSSVIPNGDTVFTITPPNGYKVQMIYPYSISKGASKGTMSVIGAEKESDGSLRFGANGNIEIDNYVNHAWLVFYE